jgi:hypothetical protein
LKNIIKVFSCEFRQIQSGRIAYNGEQLCEEAEFIAMWLCFFSADVMVLMVKDRYSATFLQSRGRPN